MKEFKPGDKVWDPRYGNGFVQEECRADEHTHTDCLYPVSVYFMDYGRQKVKKMIRYTEDGKEYTNSVHPVLFHGHDLILKPVAPQKVWVNVYWDSNVKHFFFGGLYYHEEERAKQYISLMASDKRPHVEHVKTIDLILPEDA
jgi:hypothetical protein